MKRASANFWMKLIFSFLLFSFIGWVWEGIYVGTSYGVFLNRGFLHGPWLPIYGLGGIGISLLFYHRKVNSLQIFIGSFVFSGIIEYASSFLLETLFHQRWWDYSEMFMNLNGRICLINLIAFGIAGILIIKIVFPFIEKMMEKFTYQSTLKFTQITGIIFVCDCFVSLIVPHTGMGITI